MSSENKIYPSFVIQSSIESYLHDISTKSKSILWIIIVAIVAAIAILPIIYVDVTVQTSGLIQASIEKQPIISSLSGKIIYTNLRNDSKVLAGDTLLVLDTLPIESSIRSLEYKMKEDLLFIEDLDTLLKLDLGKHNSCKGCVATPKYRVELDNFSRQLITSKRRIERFRVEHDRNTLLYKQKVISKVDYESSQFNLNNEQLQYNQLLSQQIADWQSRLTGLKEEMQKVEANLNNSYAELSKHFIISPLKGTIQQSNELQVGNNVYPNQNIAELSPDCELIAICYVKPEDIGYIKAEQEVKLQVAAYSYNQWGFLPAKIEEVSDDILMDNSNNAYFRVKCKLSSNYLSLKNGYKGYIKKGMTVSSRIIVTERSLYNLLFDKADNWFNPYTKTQRTE
ncbi:MAG: HlyD family efflux transporter periplasmic adaptor subunit [Bacteroidales bacterium]|nr:MAG: HlyD family efflux transporter periplasmic adaptor subunit [Bacteroidales bacterium]